MALRDHACLVWGAVDLGRGSSGDIMHFDCRLDDLGRAVYCGMEAPSTTTIHVGKRSESPCPQATGRPRRAQTRTREVLDSECEDDSVAELEEFAEEQSVEYFADPDNEFSAELQETEKIR